MRHGFFSGAVLVVVLSALPSHAATVLNTGGITSLNAVASDTDLSFTPNSTSRLPAALPYSDAHAVLQGGASSSNTYNFSANAFTIGMNHARPGRLDSQARSHGSVYFSVTGDSLYSLSGNYSAFDPDPRTVEFMVHLQDENTNTVLFSNRQISKQTPNEAFVLGGMGGDSFNFLASTGSTTGSLIAGHNYRLTYSGEVSTHFTGDGSSRASATGLIAMSLTPVVPTPGAFASGVVLLGGLGVARQLGRK